MKTFILSTLLLSNLLFAEAEQKENTRTPASAQHSQNVLLHLEYIELDHTDLTNLLFGEKLNRSSTEIRKELQKMVEQKKATVLESAILNSEADEAIARIESAEEYIFPTEYDPAEVAAPRVHKNGEVTGAAATGPTPTAFESQKLGLVAEFTSSIKKDIIKIDIHTNLTYHTGNFNWSTWKDERGEANISMPNFYHMEIRTGVNLTHNKYLLLGVHSPKDKEGKVNHERKVMVFVRALIQ